MIQLKVLFCCLSTTAERSSVASGKEERVRSSKELYSDGEHRLHKGESFNPEHPPNLPSLDGCNSQCKELRKISPVARPCNQPSQRIERCNQQGEKRRLCGEAGGTNSVVFSQPMGDTLISAVQHIRMATISGYEAPCPASAWSHACTLPICSPRCNERVCVCVFSESM